MILDSTALIWAVEEPTKLSLPAAAAIKDPANDLLLGAGTLWEIAIKVGLRKLALSRPYREWIEKAIADLGPELLPITVEYAEAQAALPTHLRDPFDRFVVAQSQVDGAPIVSADAALDRYGVARIW
ncbi:type II toxin-antitoxin system VapC family toxin [Aquisphaera insulae]|uniref:type II toxin-antitoxin system VapC family toxin n=1 Tax=Aquisphaera insulae TaxID=2712864 RepID=UPI0013EC7C2F|nr:type II toxin-antitoxin system VapC family toxin [Aquisphaera insulae]